MLPLVVVGAVVVVGDDDDDDDAVDGTVLVLVPAVVCSISMLSISDNVLYTGNGSFRYGWLI